MAPTTIESVGRYCLSIILSFLNELEGTSFLIVKKRYASRILPLYRLLPVDGLKIRGVKHRHHFIEYPAQDPEILLGRLNTRRLGKRCRSCQGRIPYAVGKTTVELARAEWNDKRTLFPAHLELLRFQDTREATASNETVVLVSYPRSGNTLLRNLLERVTGLVTGSDNRPDRALSRALAVDHNLVGEGVTKRVRVVKTHFPERSGFALQGSRAILLIRNPFDAIDSYWNLNLTNTHTETVVDQVYQDHADSFADMAKNELKVWIRFHLFWMKAQIPVILVRYEDLLSNMKEEMNRIIQFIATDTLSSFWKERVDHACGDGNNPSSLGSYRPRVATGKGSIGKSIAKKRYDDDLLKELHDIASMEAGADGRSLLEIFGYDCFVQGFPVNFESKTATLLNPAMVPASKCRMDINTGASIRIPDDPYGRLMKRWRMSRTNNDQDPFPIVKR